MCVCVCVAWELIAWTADWMTLLAMELSVGYFNFSALVSSFMKYG